MAQTQLQIEMFSGAGPYNAAAPGQLGAVTAGELLRHYVGPSVTSLHPGWSAVMKPHVFESFYVPQANGSDAIHGWFRFRGLGISTGLGSTGFIGAHNGVVLVVTVGVQADGHLVVTDNVGNTTVTATIVDPDVWYYFELAITQNGANCTGHSVYMKTIGGALTQIYTFAGNVSICNHLTLINYQTTGAASNWYGHVGAVGHYALGTYPTDAAYPPGITGPFAAATAWLAQTGGSAANDGVATNPWNLDTTKIVYEIQYGMFGGDTLTIDNTGTPWVIGATACVMNTWPGTITFIGEPKLHKDISGAGAGGSTVWTQYDNVTYPNVWKTTDGGATDLTGDIIYRNGAAIPAHEIGASIAANRVALNTTDTSWVDYAGDGTGTIYIYSATDPNTNADVLVRSADFMLSGSHGRTAFVILNPKNLTINNLFGRYTGWVGKADNNSVGGGVWAIEGILTGYVDLVDCGGEHWGEQCGGRGTDGANGVVRRIRPRYGTGHPYCSVGTAVADVDQVTDTSTTQTAEYTDFVSTDPRHIFWTAHSDAGILASVTMSGGNAGSQGIDTQGATTALTINASTLGGILSQAGTVTINYGSQINGLLKISGTLNFWDSKIVAAGTLSTGNANQNISGTINLYNPTIDVSGAIAGDGTASLFNRTAALALTVIGAIWIDGGKDIALVANAAAGEVVSNDNVIEKPAGSRWLETYNGGDRTGTAAIALGIDDHSVFGATIGAGIDYKLTAGSPARGLVSLVRWPALAGTLDFSGRARPATGTTDAGAYQFVSTRSSFARTRPGRNPRFARV